MILNHLRSYLRSFFFFKTGPLELDAAGDRLLILEDKFRTGYECPKCEGVGKVKCESCAGSGHMPYNWNINCNLCKDGVMICPECQGKGGLLVAPQTAERRPTTGKIVSAGPKVKNFVVGESVLYSNFAGYVLDINGQVLRILHETEVLSHIRGHLTVRRSVQEKMDSFDSANSAARDRSVV